MQLNAVSNQIVRIIQVQFVPTLSIFAGPATCSQLVEQNYDNTVLIKTCIPLLKFHVGYDNTFQSDLTAVDVRLSKQHLYTWFLLMPITCMVISAQLPHACRCLLFHIQLYRVLKLSEVGLQVTLYDSPYSGILAYS